jgi:haloalkane dehalogenase
VIPDWVDRYHYPFTPKALAVDAGTLRYLDEGEGRPIVMVHGTPSWSFLYRHLVRDLRERYRCVVPDHLGYGLSDKPLDYDYAPPAQARNVATLIETLGLKDVTLVVHDFGGPIGLAYAIDHPENVRQLVLFNTWMWSFRGDARMERAARLFGGALGRLLYERLGFSVNVVWRTAIKDRRRYTSGVHRQYAAAVASPAARRATLQTARALLGASDWYDGLWNRRDRLTAIPALLAWGMKDPAFGAYLPRWRALFPRADVVELDCGHAPPEERAPELLPSLRAFLDKESP